MRPMSRLSALLIGVAAICVLAIALNVAGGPSWLAFAIGGALVAFLWSRSGSGGDRDEPPHPSHATADGRAEVARMRAVAAGLPREEGRAKVSAVCDTADRVITALERNGDARGALALLEHYLEPASAFFTQYARLADRALPTTEGALIKAETRDLPLLAAKLRELEIRLERGEVIDIEAGDAILDFDLGNAALPPRRR